MKLTFVERHTTHS